MSKSFLRTPLQSWVPNCPISEQKTRDPIGSWILFLGVCPNVHQPSTEESDIWHFCDFKETRDVFLVCWGEVQILGREQQKKRKTRHEKRRTLMYSSTCFAASKPKLTACGVRSPGILGSIMALWRPFAKPWASIMSQKCGFRFSLVARETKLNFRKGLSHILGPF